MKLSFEEGDLVYISEQHDGGWWRGTCKGRSGLVPSNYLVADEDEENSGPNATLQISWGRSAKNWSSKVIFLIIYIYLLFFYLFNDNSVKCARMRWNLWEWKPNFSWLLGRLLSSVGDQILFLKLKKHPLNLSQSLKKYS